MTNLWLSLIAAWVLRGDFPMAAKVLAALRDEGLIVTALG
jgi:hypothetical protein